MSEIKRTLIGKLEITKPGETVEIRGWIRRIRALAQSTFVIVYDQTGEVQVVFATEALKGVTLRNESCIAVTGRVVAEARSRSGFEIRGEELRILNLAAEMLPFKSSQNVATLSPELFLQNRPLALRHPKLGAVFRVQAEILEQFRAYLRSEGFTEIVTSKIVSSGTEGGSNLFELKYFERKAYLAQSPQFYKEHGVGGLERVFETGHVYRAEPHASSRHLTEYFSLDVEMGFIGSVLEVIELERALLGVIFSRINEKYGETLAEFKRPALPVAELAQIPVWSFALCLEKLRAENGTRHLTNDLDPEAERTLCQIAKRECGVAAVFVLGFPIEARPFYTMPLPEGFFSALAQPQSPGAAASFDLLYEGLEITTGGQRLHERAQLEAALTRKGFKVSEFESHLRMFELGMPPHGGFALGLERLTAQILGLPNVREATLYPRDRYHVSP